MILEPRLAWPPPARVMVDGRFVARRVYQLADIARAFGVLSGKLATQDDQEGLDGPAATESGA